jgi:carbonic anhydrase
VLKLYQANLTKDWNMNFARSCRIVVLMCLFSLSQNSLALVVQPVHKTVMTKELQSAMTPELALQHLQEGNQRFVTGTMKNRDLVAQAKLTSVSQHPSIVILNCIDSRTPPEIIFDQGIGDIFAIRIAGNVQNKDILGSMEFGTKVAGAKLIAVIGHTSCGAVRGACQQVKLGNLTGLLQKIQPAVKQAAKEAGTTDCDQAAFIDQIAKDNVLLVMKQIEMQSPLIAKLIQEGKIKLVGGMQDIATGKVTFFNDKS